jgi:drug/metabolite transporter (DMT)-like permease
MLGAFFALLAAASFGFDNASARRGVLSGTVIQAMSITVPLGLPMFFIPALLAGQLAALTVLTPLQCLYLSLAGIMHFVIGRYGNYRALVAMGANLAGSLMQLNLLLSLFLAVIFLDERMTVLRFAGIAMILGGTAITLGRRQTAGAAPPKFVPNYREGLLFGALCALGYGVSPVLIRAALENSGNGMMGGFVSYVAATIVVATWFSVSPRSRQEVRNTHPEAVRWFLLAGIAVNVSQFFRYLALSIAPVIIVAPIIQLAGTFRVLFGWLINREHEILDARVIVGLVMAFAGALLLAIQVRALADLVDLPPALIQFLGAGWP